MSTCPRCGIELRVKERDEEGRVLLECRNPKCEDYRRIVAEEK